MICIRWVNKIIPCSFYCSVYNVDRFLQYLAQSILRQFETQKYLGENYLLVLSILDSFAGRLVAMKRAGFLVLRGRYRHGNGHLQQMTEGTTIGTAVTQAVKDSSSSKMVLVMQDWLQAKCPGFIEKNQWPPSSPGFNLLDCHIWAAMLKKVHKLQPKRKTIRLMSWKSLWRLSGKSCHKNTSTRRGKHHQALDCMCGCQWALRSPAVRVHFQVCMLISAPKIGLFQSRWYTGKKQCPKCS